MSQSWIAVGRPARSDRALSKIRHRQFSPAAFWERFRSGEPRIMAGILDVLEFDKLLQGQECRPHLWIEEWKCGVFDELSRKCGMLLHQSGSLEVIALIVFVSTKQSICTILTRGR
ncbi:hypothetical protein QC763_0025930 [Podospora pseudopauciseta]|uniref:Uncharacterized protein n=1 Tax=Podospora pseudopauciseta TaxID=2093780 RepID=A0ABR0I2I9_9PEZI|nr:hypothetical protein QC763_0025930 [Podospora pseudopauciseta]